MIISVDAMGGDFAPSVVVKGAIEALNRYSDISIKLVGNKDLIKRELQMLRSSTHPRIEVVHADEVVLMDDHPSDIVRGKRKSSMHVGLKQVRDKEADAFFSAGNSGAVMAVAMVTLGMLKGISRPALGTVGPSSSHSGKFFILDIGANVDCKPEHLQAFAIMGVAYANRVLKVANPTVGILSNGEEEGKGDNLTKATYELLKKNKSINFVGNIEAKALFKGEADVIVCDGFAGNIAIKTSQSIANLLFSTLKSEINKSIIYKIGALMLKDVFIAAKKKGDGSHYGGAPLLGVNGVCVIGHGSSNEIGVMNGIRVAREAVYNKMNKAIIEGIEAL